MYNMVMEDTKTDEELVLLVQKGDIQQFGVLVGRYEAKMRRYAKRFLYSTHDGEDAIQEVFLKAYSNIQGFDIKRNFSAWLYRIAHNEFINTIRKIGKEPLPFFDPDTIFPHPVAKDNPQKELDDKEMAEALNKFLDKLDPKYRETLILYYFEEMDYDSIAEVMRVPRSTVGVRLRRGKIILKEIYTKSNYG